MSIKNFFRKIGSGFRKAGRWIRDKALPVVGRIVKPILNVVGLLPGKIGMIGKVGSAIAGAASNVIDKIPNQQVKDKLHGIVDTVNGKIQEGVNKGQQMATVANDIVNATRQGVGNVASVVKPAVVPPTLKTTQLM